MLNFRMTERENDIFIKKRMSAFPYGENAYCIQSFKFSVERSTAYFYNSAHKEPLNLQGFENWLVKNLSAIISSFRIEPVVSTHCVNGRLNATITEWNENIEINQVPISRTIRVKYTSLIRYTNSAFHFLLKE